MSAAPAEQPAKPLFKCSPSKLLAYDNCPRAYRHAYLDRPTPPKRGPWAHQSLGNAAHLALATWWDQPDPDRTPDRGADLVRRHWQDRGFRDPAQSEANREVTADQVAHYLTGVDPHARPAGIERTVSLVTDTLNVSGRIDRVDRHPTGPLRIVDYKFGGTPPSDDDARYSLPLALYAAAAMRTLRAPAWRVELHHVPSERVVAHTHDRESLAKRIGEAKQLGADAVAAAAAVDAGKTPDEAFPAKPGPLCGWCDFRDVCPPGAATSRAVEPWAGVADI